MQLSTTFLLRKDDAQADVTLHRLQRRGALIEKSPSGNSTYVSTTLSVVAPGGQTFDECLQMIAELSTHMPHAARVELSGCESGGAQEFFVGPDADSAGRSYFHVKAAHYARLAGLDDIANAILGRVTRH